MAEKNLQRRSFFTSMFGAAAVTAGAAVAKSGPDTIAVTPYSSWMCPECGCCMQAERDNLGDYNPAHYRMWCTFSFCKNFEIHVRVPQIQTLRVAKPNC